MSTVETQAEPEVATPPVIGFPEHRITVARYLKMVEAGVFGRGDHVFLWHGRLVEKMTKGRPHSYTALKLNKLLDRIIPADWHVELEQSMDLGDDSLPEPDLMVIRGTLEEYKTRIPKSQDILLIVEVADSSVAQDRGAKLLDYAVAAIPVYWLVSIPQRRVEVYSRPSGPTERPGYGDRTDYGIGAEVSVVLDGQEVGRIVMNQFLS